MWNARNKLDLIFEVWEKLDCESIGRTEIEAIEMVVGEQYGASAVDSPMVIARLLADEGAQLRHSEIMALFVERASDQPYAAVLRNLIRIDDLASTRTSLVEMTNLWRKYKSEGDRQGLEHVANAARNARKRALELSASRATKRDLNTEIAEWLRVWLETPEIFSSWVDIRMQTDDFKERLGAEFNK